MKMATVAKERRETVRKMPCEGWPLSKNVTVEDRPTASLKSLYLHYPLSQGDNVIEARGRLARSRMQDAASCRMQMCNVHGAMCMVQSAVQRVWYNVYGAECMDKV